jgi:hypothetical protein
VVQAAVAPDESQTYFAVGNVFKLCAKKNKVTANMLETI